MMEKPIWWDYAVFGEYGLKGIKDDAPVEIKKLTRNMFDTSRSILMLNSNQLANVYLHNLQKT